MPRYRMGFIRPNPQSPELEEDTLWESDAVYAGMFPDINPDKVPKEGLSIAKNAVIREGKTRRRPGTTLYSPAKPNATKILHIVDYVNTGGTIKIVRHTRNTLHYATAAAWVNVVGVLNGTDTDQIRAIIANDRYLFTNNGVDVIQEVNFGANTFAALSATAPKVKRIFGFNNRIIGVNVKAGPAPYTIANANEVVWSGNNAYAQWDYAIDTSAGFRVLSESPSELADPLMDGFGFDRIGLLVRQRSLWMMTVNRASATEPFFFDCVIPGVGSSCEYGAMDIDRAIAFPDLMHKDIYVFRPGDLNQGQDFRIETIGGAARKSIMGDISDPAKVFSSYDPIEKEYSLCIPTTGTDLVKQWTYNFEYKAWTYSEFQYISCVSDVANVLSGVTIDELQGTIDGLPGDIDSLSNPTATLPRRLYGRTDGEIVIVTEVNSDYVNSNVSFTEDLQSGSLNIPKEDQDITVCYFRIKPHNSGTILLEISLDQGNNWSSRFKKSFTITDAMNHKPILLKYRQLIHCENFMWRLTSSNVIFELLSYDIKGTPTGGSQK